MQSLIIFASGRGSNAQAIIDYFNNDSGVEVALIVSNKKDAGVLQIAADNNIPSLVVDKQSFNNSSFADTLKGYTPSLIVLAGFLWKVPDAVVKAFSGKIINIHPALLPSYGGKGMYGHHVHEAVIAAKEQESGITIHYVDEVYDNGGIILQARCTVSAEDSPDSLAQRIHKLEHFFFPRTIEYMLESK
ncbi:MAG: phosphoribosylglycinamide formyltransferase [Chitinophagales bacterium]|nr:phosphoribosylglycinamide formyltransferase [Chitinophagaceae bacterium]MCB9064176.1 phosphoribosylglycinamide formyltransferase [Chitinophagales bacterium]